MGVAQTFDGWLMSADEADPERRSSKLDALRSYLLLHGAVRSWMWVVFTDYMDPTTVGITAAWLTACFAMSFSGRTRAIAARIALPVLFLQTWWSFPLTDNHFFLELYALCFVALVGDQREDESLAFSALIWLSALVLFHSGLQKILYGSYFGGEFLAWAIGADQRFESLFGLLLPAEELTRLKSYGAMTHGAGPYRVDSPLFLVVSNLVYIVEIGLGLLLVWPRTRLWAARVAVVVVLALQLAAREMGFAFLFANILFLGLNGPWGRRTLPWLIGLYLFVLMWAYGGFSGLPIPDPGFL